MKMERFKIYEKDVERWENGKIKSRKTMATFLSGNQKGKKINLSSMCNIKIEDLVGKEFFAKVMEVNGTNYIVACFVK